jgi:hypothetical protein
MGIICALGLLLYLPPAQAEEARYYKIEAAFLYNFFNYITWPGYASPEALMQPTICLDGNDPVEPYLAYIQQKMISQHRLHVHTLHEGDSFEGCNMLFLRGTMSEDRLRDALKNHTLIVTGPDDPVDRGGMIQLTKEDERLVMDIDQSLLIQGGFKVSSRLLDLAEQIR